MRLASLSVLLAAACAAPAPAHAPLVCDDGRDGEIAFVFHRSAAFFAPYEPHGSALLVVEGSCRFHVFSSRGIPGELRSGTLGADDLDALNAELLTADWESLDGERVSFGTGADAETITLRREELVAQCYYDCTAHDALQALEQRGFAWVGRLWERGVAVDGPVELDGYASSLALGDVPHVAWTGDADLAALFEASPYPARPRIDDPEDAALLRRLRSEAESAGNPPLFLEQGGALFEVGVADALPFALELFVDRNVPW